MPAIKSLTEFNRNQNAIIDELARTQEPLYLTRNGSAAVVVVDAAAYDREQSRKAERIERELRLRDGLMRGYQDVLDGKTLPACDAMAAIRAAKGW